jgi:hypothetical protein
MAGHSSLPAWAVATAVGPHLFDSVGSFFNPFAFGSLGTGGFWRRLVTRRLQLVGASAEIKVVMGTLPTATPERSSFGFNEG